MKDEINYKRYSKLLERELKKNNKKKWVWIETALEEVERNEDINNAKGLDALTIISVCSVIISIDLLFILLRYSL